MSTKATPDFFLSGLNDPQREAVVHTDGPLLILAGPGSGKTRVVTRRAAYLAATVASPWQILAITFTNKAAREMRERIDALRVGEGMTVCTFHALCARWLRMFCDRAGVLRNFTILDRDDRRKLLKRAITECDLSPTNFSPAAVEAVISTAKNDMQTAEEFALEDLDWRQRTIARIYLRYEQLCQETGTLDFDDLLMKVARLLLRDAALCEELEDRYRYVLIDEYQDTNAAQYAIARLLTKQRENLCATGDPDQSIYGWRGANIENILTFEQDYPSAKVVRLEQNYRSTGRILAAADALIAGNEQRKEKTLWTENEEGAAVRVVEYESGDEEATEIAHGMAELLRQGFSPGEMAVFYRINSLSRVMEEALLREGIKYQIARGVEFYNRKEIKDVLAYLRVMVNPTDEVALLRIINTPPRGIGATTVKRLIERVRDRSCSVVDLLGQDEELDTLGRSAGKLRRFRELLTELAPAMKLSPVQALEHVISRSGLRALYGGENAADDTATDNLDELVSAASSFAQEHGEATLVDWLEHTALVSDVDAVEEGQGAVTLMTLHAAKGLEFDVVYMIGLEEGLLPFRRQGDVDGSDEEEERRLCFVGMTRAKRRLTLCRARYRMRRGVTERTVRSPFLDELPRDQLEWQKYAPSASGKTSPRDLGRLPDDIDQWAVGSLVEHPVRGLGQIFSLHRGPRRTSVEVRFRDGTRQPFVLEFADLVRVDFDDIG